ncbi:MAG: L-asparagine permease [Actinomycetota bacterium]|nr:L-asparagine permease [Actinomycetota bacterium]
MTEQTLTPEATADAGDAGYHKALKPRHVNMIAIGGAIGTGGRLAQAGPALAIVYAVCGLFAFFVVRALGELILYRPSSGAFVSYAREFMGEKGAYAAGWMHFLNWSTTGIADITAVALAVVLTLNLVSVKLFGEMEFWFAIVKVAALVLFMVIGIVLLATQTPIDGVAGGPQLITGHGGIFPAGLLPMVMIVQGVVFAYASVELVGVAAGETENPEKIMPKAINSIMWRIAVFYVGSVVLLAMLLPWSSYTKDQSPFVTVLSHLGVPAADSVMNLVVLTAALSSLNSGLYSTGRILRSMATAGSAPKFTGVMNRNQVPYGGILLTASVCVLGVGLNHLVPKEAFDIVLNFAAIGILATWAIIVLCHLLFVRKTKRDGLERPSFRLPFSPYTEIVTLVFLAAVVVLMGFDETGRITLTALPVIALALVAGWFAVRKRIDMRAFDKAGL